MLIIKRKLFLFKKNDKSLFSIWTYLYYFNFNFEHKNSNNFVLKLFNSGLFSDSETDESCGSGMSGGAWSPIQGKGSWSPTPGKWAGRRGRVWRGSPVSSIQNQDCGTKMLTGNINRQYLINWLLTTIHEQVINNKTDYLPLSMNR